MLSQMRVAGGYSPQSVKLNSLNGGIVLSDLPYRAGINQSPDCKNVWFAGNVLGKRPGQEYIYIVRDVITGDPIKRPIVAATDRPWNGNIVYHIGTELRNIDATSKADNHLCWVLSTACGTFLPFGDYLYYLNGEQYLKIDKNFEVVPFEPYIPVILMNSAPTGGGDILEDYNRIGAGFTVKFSGTDAAQDFQLPEKNLDQTPVKVISGGTEKTVGIHYDVNRTTGVIHFYQAVTPGTNGLEITAYKTVQADIDSIKKCRYMTTYGGENEVKIVVGGNPDTPNCFYASGTLDGTYFPMNLYNYAGSTDEIITGFGNQYDILVIFKERSIWGGSYNVDGSKVRIPVIPINQQIGCDCPRSIQVVNNNLVWCATYGGVYGLFSTDNDDERNVMPLSANINGTYYNLGLLAEDNLEKAISVDFDGRYWLCVNGKVYLWDYTLAPFTGDAKALSWWLFDNIRPGAFTIADKELWYGCGDIEAYVRFIDFFRDFDKGIEAHWWMAPTDFGSTRRKKTVTDVVITSRGQTATKAKIKYRTDYSGWDEPNELNIRSFSLKQFSLNTFTLNVTPYAKPQRRKLLAKHVDYFQMGFFNEAVNRDLSITDIDIKFFFEGEVT